MTPAPRTATSPAPPEHAGNIPPVIHGSGFMETCNQSRLRILQDSPGSITNCKFQSSLTLLFLLLLFLLFQVASRKHRQESHYKRGQLATGCLLFLYYSRFKEVSDCGGFI